MYYSYVEIEYVAMSFYPAKTDLAVKLLRCIRKNLQKKEESHEVLSPFEYRTAVIYQPLILTLNAFETACGINL